MRFRQLDEITQLTPGVDVSARLTVSHEEGYFRDHFPQFAVMPGVLTLESMFQTCSWLVRKTEGFASSVVLLKEARNVKFAGLVRPGQTLTLSASIKNHGPQTTTLAAEATLDGQMVASGRLVLERFNLADRNPRRAPTDTHLRQAMRAEFDRLHPPCQPARAATRYRWMWIDRFREFISGRRAVAVKTVSMADEPIDLYMPGFPVMPCSLIIEGFAQTGGILVGAGHDFEKRIVLAKVSKAAFHGPAVPGDSLVYEVEIESLQPEGAMVRGTSRIGDELHGEVSLFFAYLDERIVDGELIGPADVLLMLRAYGLYDVGRNEDGTPLQIPERLLCAEREALEEGPAARQ
jgi:3-hydroxyacyl-[acyl-carrier-protein] dehydratase